MYTDLPVFKAACIAAVSSVSLSPVAPKSLTETLSSSFACTVVATDPVSLRWYEISLAAVGVTAPASGEPVEALKYKYFPTRSALRGRDIDTVGSTSCKLILRSREFSFWTAPM